MKPFLIGLFALKFSLLCYNLLEFHCGLVLLFSSTFIFSFLINDVHAHNFKREIAIGIFISNKIKHNSHPVPKSLPISYFSEAMISNVSDY